MLMHNRLVLVFVLILSSLFYVSHTGIAQNNDPIVPSSPTDVVIIEEAIYEKAKGNERPIVTLKATVYWEQLGGTLLNFFINTSDVITDNFWDYQSGQAFAEEDDGQNECVRRNGGNFETVSSNCVTRLSDRYMVVPSSRSFSYVIDAYYDPDIIEDTGFIVIFNSQSVDFSILVDNVIVYARVDYSNKITLPWNAGIVSYAPIEETSTGERLYPEIEKIIGSEGERYSLHWEYKHRAMDSRHDPLIIAVTYSFDPIFLKFTDQVYQNQKENQQRLEEENRLNLLNTSFVVIATLAVIASIFSIILAYLIARRKFNSDLQRAKELPRRAVQDIEKADSLQIPIKSIILSAMIILPTLLHPIPIQGQLDNNIVDWKGVYDLNRDSTLMETVYIDLPIQKDVVYIYTNTSAVIDIAVFNQNHMPIIPIADGNRYIVNNPTKSFSYVIHRPFKVYNNSNMLVYLDRFWLEFSRPDATIEEDVFRANMDYTVLLPDGAILYSASPTPALEPSINMQISKTGTGRNNITFSDKNRLMDAFHDVFETQITFSYIGILDALDNLNSDFEVARAKTQDIQSFLKVARSEIMLFSILGLIAPLISFFIAYWVFRNRYKKKISEYEQQQEEQIFVEAPHIAALSYATEKLNKSNYRESYIGHYWRLMNKISEMAKKDFSIYSVDQVKEELSRKNMKYDQMKLTELISLGNNMMLTEEQVDFGQLYDYSKQVDDFLQTIKLK